MVSLFYLTKLGATLIKHLLLTTECRYQEACANYSTTPSTHGWQTQPLMELYIQHKTAAHVRSSFARSALHKVLTGRTEVLRTLQYEPQQIYRIPLQCVVRTPTPREGTANVAIHRTAGKHAINGERRGMSPLNHIHHTN